MHSQGYIRSRVEIDGNKIPPLQVGTEPLLSGSESVRTPRVSSQFYVSQVKCKIVRRSTPSVC